MVKLDKIYTKGGDKGETSLGDGQRVKKHNLRVQTFGEIEEANALIGCSLIYTSKESIKSLRRIQNDLFDLGADLCIPDSSEKKELKVLLDIISRNIPLADIIDNNDEEPANHDTLYAEIDIEDILANEKKQAQQLLQIFLQSGEIKSEAIEKILSVEPFVRHKQELSYFLKK